MSRNSASTGPVSHPADAWGDVLRGVESGGAARARPGSKTWAGFFPRANLGHRSDWSSAKRLNSRSRGEFDGASAPPPQDGACKPRQRPRTRAPRRFRPPPPPGHGRGTSFLPAAAPRHDDLDEVGADSSSRIGGRPRTRSTASARRSQRLRQGESPSRGRRGFEATLPSPPSVTHGNAACVSQVSPSPSPPLHSVGEDPPLRGDGSARTWPFNVHATPLVAVEAPRGSTPITKVRRGFFHCWLGSRPRPYARSNMADARSRYSRALSATKLVQPYAAIFASEVGSSFFALSPRRASRGSSA